MDVVYHLGQATAAEVHERLPDAPTYTTVRGLLRVLERKGHLRHQEDGPRYVYAPTAPRESTGTSHLAHVIRTFFGGSTADAMAALLGTSAGRSSAAELERLASVVERARDGKRG